LVIVRKDQSNQSPGGHVPTTTTPKGVSCTCCATVWAAHNSLAPCDHCGHRLCGPRNIDTGSYQASHGQAPAGRGTWSFYPASLDLTAALAQNLVETRYNVTYSEALQQLQAGDWIVCA
jgi:hypothetical protein